MINGDDNDDDDDDNDADDDGDDGPYAELSALPPKHSNKSLIEISTRGTPRTLINWPK